MTLGWIEAGVDYGLMGCLLGFKRQTQPGKHSLRKRLAARKSKKVYILSHTHSFIFI